MSTIYDDPEYMQTLRQRLETQPIRDTIAQVRARIDRYERRVRELEALLKEAKGLLTTHLEGPERKLAAEIGELLEKSREWPK